MKYIVLWYPAGLSYPNAHAQVFDKRADAARFAESMARKHQQVEIHDSVNQSLMVATFEERKMS